MGKSKSSSPDPYATAAAQTASNKDTAKYQTQLNMVNQYTPQGNLRYDEIGTWSDGTPRYQLTQELSDIGQKAQGQNDQTTLNLATLANQQSNFLNKYFADPLDTSSAPDLQSSYAGADDFSADRNAVTNALMSRMQPTLDQNRDNLRSTLIAQGIRPGTAAWDSELGRLSQSENDASMAALLAGGQEQSRLVGLAQNAASFNNSARSQSLNEQYAKRNQPLNEINALISGSQVSNPVQLSTPQTSVAGTDIAGLVTSNAAGATSSNNALMGGLFGLGSAGINRYSDIRLKEDISRVGTLDNGLPVYLFHYKGDPSFQIGLMAQDVEAAHPEAVSEDAEGYKRVDYRLAVL